MVQKDSLRAFTLIELLLVLVILAVLASVSLPIYFGKVDKTKYVTTVTEIANLKSALTNFELDNSRFPTTAEGLEALVRAPAGLELTWSGPYIEQITNDKYGNPYLYVSPGTDDPTSFDLSSAGKDGTHGTDDDITKYTQ